MGRKRLSYCPAAFESGISFSDMMQEHFTWVAPSLYANIATPEPCLFHQVSQSYHPNNP